MRRSATLSGHPRRPDPFAGPASPQTFTGRVESPLGRSCSDWLITARRLAWARN